MVEQYLPRQTFRAMGCTMTVLLSAPVGAQSDALLAQVPMWFAAWEQKFSRFRADSELSRVNAQARKWVTVSAEFLSVVQRAWAMAERTQGLITPLVGQAVMDLGYDRDFSEICTMPHSTSAHILDGCTAIPTSVITDDQPVQWDQDGSRIRIPTGCRLDLGGFVKGWCADEVVRRLQPFAPVLMDAGGDIAVSGLMVNGYAWPVAIARPFSDIEDLAVLGLSRGGVATSGRDYRRWWHNGHMQHHIVDPRTAQSAQTDVLSVSVLAESAFLAESVAKYLLILGSEQARQWWQGRADVGVCLVLQDGATLMNDVFERHIWHE